MRSSLTVSGIGMELLLVPTISLCACADDEVSSYLDKDGLIARRDALINEIMATRMARMHSEMFRGIPPSPCQPTALITSETLSLETETAIREELVPMILAPCTVLLTRLGVQYRWPTFVRSRIP